MDTPREVLFDVFHRRWNISNKDLATAILLDKSVTSGKSPRELIEVRSTLTRLVVHVQPGENVEGWIAPFDQVVPRVLALVRASRKPHGTMDIVSTMTGEGSERMRASLVAFGGDGALYMNMVARIGGSGSGRMADLAELATALFVVAGCTGDARRAAEYTLGLAQRFARTTMLRTEYSEAESRAMRTRPPKAYLGLYRMEGGLLVGVPYRLSLGADGTEIGSLSLAPGSINDVGAGVSRRHACVWCDASGRWFVRGLGSTNGTVKVDSRGRKTAVEPPRAHRGGDYVPQAVPLQVGDHLILAGTTEFVVVALSAE